MTEKERLVEEAKAALDNAEAQSRDDLERKKRSRRSTRWMKLTTALFKSLEEHREAVRRLRDQMRAVQDDLATVLGILDELSKGYNPNGQDMAVKAAVVGYKELIGAQEDAQAVPETEDEGIQGEEVEEAKVEPKVEPKLNTVRDPDGHLANFDVDKIVNMDLEGLLVSDDSDDDDEGLREPCD